MPKSRNNKTHKKRVSKFKNELKQKQNSLKKQMIENYMKLQQEAIANQENHSSTHDVLSPDINIDDLIQDWDNNISNEIKESKNITELDLDIQNIENTENVDVHESETVVDNADVVENIEKYDNNNQ